jgi:thiol peroxidase
VGALPKDRVEMITVSMDLPFAQHRWRAEAGATHRLVSAHKNERFAKEYGLLVEELRLLRRAVFVIGPDDRVAYAEYVKDQLDEPDYQRALEAVKALLP